MSNRRRLSRQQRRHARGVFVEDQLQALTEVTSTLIRTHAQQLGADLADGGRHPIAVALAEQLGQALHANRVRLCRHARTAVPTRLYWLPPDLLRRIVCHDCATTFVAKTPERHGCGWCGVVAPLSPFTFPIGPIVVLAALCDRCVTGSQDDDTGGDAA